MADLTRFIKAHEAMYDIAITEIIQGLKQSHWMWYIFPQIKGLGSSEMATYYAIDDLEEAKEYMDNPYLNHHMMTLCTELLNYEGLTSKKIFGYTDSVKLKSSMTLFYYATKIQIFKDVIDKYYNGDFDDKTIKIIKGEF